jgi:hypothetical protein
MIRALSAGAAAISRSSQASAKLAGVIARRIAQAVDTDQPRALHVERVLHIPTLDHWRVRENPAKQRPVIMVAQHQMHRHPKWLQRLLHGLVCPRLALVREVTGDQNQLRVAETLIDQRDRVAQPVPGTGAVKQPVTRDTMRVGDLDKSHDCPLGTETRADFHRILR